MKKVLLVLAVLILLALAIKLFMFGPLNEKQAYIDATVEAGCYIAQNAENPFDPEVEIKVRAIFEDYGFDADDDEEMTAIHSKYESDAEVQQSVLTGVLENCDLEPLGVNDLEQLIEEEAEAEVEAEMSEEENTEEAAGLEVNAEVEVNTQLNAEVAE